MARTGISYEQVAHAADTLMGRGEKPTIQAIRAEIGTGSPNTIHKHLTAWKAAQAPAERQAARLPDDLARVLADEIERQASAARADAEASALDAQQTADHLATTGEKLESEAEELRESAETLEAERDTVTGERDAALAETERLRGELERERQSAETTRQKLAEATNRIQTLEEQRDEMRDALAQAVSDGKASEAARVAAEREQAVALANLKSAEKQAAERATALEAEQQARRDDAEGHKQALVEQRNEWKERLASIENQAQEARKQAQEAEKGRTKEQTRAEALAARLEAFEARDAQTAKKRNADDQPTLPFDDQNPA